jgi:hypothetical protein
MAKNVVKAAAKQIKSDNERGSRLALIEDLFYDFNRNRVEVYKMNFIRGIFFGFGSILGGTVVIALLAWLLSFFVEIPGIGDSIQQVQDSIQSDRK